MAAGYSGTPLARKLGIVENTRVFVQDAPRPYRELIAPAPDGFVLARTLGDAAIIHFFLTRRVDLERSLERVRKQMASDAALWVSWPKRSSKVATDITEDVIREVCLPLGLVDIKVCAVDEVWSGLKLMIRKELRSAQENTNGRKRAQRTQR